MHTIQTNFLTKIKNYTQAVFYAIIAHLIKKLAWRWRDYAPPKSCNFYTNLHSIYIP